MSLDCANLHGVEWDGVIVHRHHITLPVEKSEAKH